MFKSRISSLFVLVSCVAGAVTPLSAQPVTNLNVLSFNVLVSGQRGLDKITEAIRRSGADIVGLQEIAAAPAAITQLATNLGFYSLQGVSVISRYPILGRAVPGNGEVQNGVTIQLSPGQRIHLFNCHLAPFPYGPYYIRDGQSSNATYNLEATTRLPQITNLLAIMAPYLAVDEPCFLTGDFNAPSHVDYASFPWPVSVAVHNAGLRDSYRELHPGNRTFPPAFTFDEAGITWTPDGSAADNTFDRIDFVYFSNGDGVTALSSMEQDGRNNFSPWPSDHRAVLSRFRLTPPVATDKATRPFPLSQAIAVATNVQLSWLAGSNATAHVIYFGATSPGTLVRTQANASFDPGLLNIRSTYYWRIDEMTPSGVVTGDVWRFTTVDPSGQAVYEWTFDNANLAAALGGGVMTYADAASSSLTRFGTTDGTTVPHIAGQPAVYMNVPAFTGVSNGYLLNFTQSGPNGGGSYINRFTIIFDLLIPSPLNWTALFNTNPENANDADWYVDNDGRLGIGELGYSSAGLFTPNVWQRIAFAADLTAGTVSFYRNGGFVQIGSSSLDGRFSIYSNIDPGADLLLFNENDSSGVYTHTVLLNSVAFVDRTLSGAEIADLAGPRAEGIFFRRLRAMRQGADVLLSWNSGPSTRLQRATTFSPFDWQDVPGTLGASNIIQAVTNAMALYRLMQP